MDRKRWIIAGIALVLFIALSIFGLITLYGRLTAQTEDTGQRTPASELTYCNEDQAKPCVVSFATDAEGNMLVNLLLPDLAFPNFYLKIQRGENSALYECQRIASVPNNAYCIGEKVPPGETLRLMLISVKDDILLAQGDLSIIGLAFPTLEISIPTPTDTPSEALSPTEPSDFVLPTATRLQPAKPTQTQPPYPNPPYP